MKKIVRTTALLLAALAILAFSGCGLVVLPDVSSGSASGSTSEAAVPVVDTAITAEEATGDFTITTEDGKVASSGSVYTVSAAGTYSLAGNLTGQILVEAGEEDEVILDSPVNESFVVCQHLLGKSLPSPSSSAINSVNRFKYASLNSEGPIASNVSNVPTRAPERSSAKKFGMPVRFWFFRSGLFQPPFSVFCPTSDRLRSSTAFASASESMWREI